MKNILNVNSIKLMARIYSMARYPITVLRFWPLLGKLGEKRTLPAGVLCSLGDKTSGGCFKYSVKKQKKYL